MSLKIKIIITLTLNLLLGNYLFYNWQEEAQSFHYLVVSGWAISLFIPTLKLLKSQRFSRKLRVFVSALGFSFAVPLCFILGYFSIADFVAGTHFTKFVTNLYYHLLLSSTLSLLVLPLTAQMLFLNLILFTWITRERIISS